MATPIRTYHKLLVISLCLNLVGALGGGVYAYMKRHVFIRLYDSYFGVQVQDEVAGPPKISPQMRYHNQRLQAFTMLELALNAQRLIVFAGDSLVQTFSWAEYFAERVPDAVIVNRGINGDTIDQVASRIEVTFLPEHHPEKIFLMIGINDINSAGGSIYFHPQEIGSKYTTLLEKVSLKVAPERICVQSVLPVRGKGALINSAIKSVNELVASYARANGFCYIELYDRFADPTGQLMEDYAFDDGIHLSSEGYRLWLKILTPYVLN